MARTIEKICLAIIYAGLAVILSASLFVNSDFFFPFISTRVFIIRPAVEIILLAFLALNVVSDKYRPRLNLLAGAVLLFLVISFVSSALGGNFTRSFWGDIERGEGLILWLHLLALLVVLTAVIRKKAVWLGYLDFSIGIATLLSFFGLAQALRFSAVLATSGSRIDATFGNAAFFAAYLLFNLAFAAYLFTQRNSKWAKCYYAAVSLVFVFMIVATETRGAVIGFLAGILFAALLYAYHYRGRRAVKWTALGVISFILLAAAGLYIFRNSAFVQESPKLARLASISIAERTAQTRLATWEAGWRGWQEKFFMGWGAENFDVVFNSHFPPVIYEDEGSEVWFDRAHNMIFDRGVTTGILGLLAFLSIFLYPLYYFLRYLLKDPSSRPAAIIFSGFILAYLIQDLFIFESINIYVIWFFALAFWSVNLLPEYGLPKICGSRKLWIGVLAIYGAAFLPLLNKVNLYPAKINLKAAVALRSTPREQDFFATVDRYKAAIEPDTYGRVEYRLQYIEFVSNQLANLGEVVPEVKPVLAYTDDQVLKQLEEGGRDAKNHLLAMRYYNFTFASDPAVKLERINKALSFFSSLEELTPTRPQIYQEAGYSYTYLYRNYLEQNDLTKASEAFGQAEKHFKLALDLNPKVVESYVNLVMLYLNSADDDKVSEVVRQMEERGVNFRKRRHLSKMYNLALGTNRVKWIGYFSEELTKLNADDVEAWINLAVFYATSGNREKAIEIAGKIKEFGGEYIKQADLFIESVNKGEYEKK